MEAMRYSIRRNSGNGGGGLAIRLLLLLAVAIGGMTGMSAQTREEGPLTAREVFANLQAPELDLLKKTTRLDMTDYWEADSVFKAVNGLGGVSELEALTADYVKVKMTPVSTVELKLLPGKGKEKIVACVYTVGSDTQAEDSQITFYDSRLQPLDAKKYFKQPDLKDFFDIPKGSATTIKEIREMVPFPTVAYSMEADSNELTARLTVEKYINVDDWNIIKLFLKPEIKAEWKGKWEVKK